MRQARSLPAAATAVRTGPVPVWISGSRAALLCAALLAAPAHAALTTGDAIAPRPARLAPDVALSAPSRPIPVEAFRLLDVTAAPTLGDAPRPSRRGVECASLAAEDCYAASWAEVLVSRARDTLTTSWIAAPFFLVSLAAFAWAGLRRVRAS